MKVEELERVRQSEMIKEKELHRLQDMYAEEIRKHTEDLAKARKAESDLAMMQHLALTKQQQVAYAYMESPVKTDSPKKRTPKKVSPKKTKAKRSPKSPKRLSPKKPGRH